ncbi:MAG: DUF1223 domain-containing protein [Alphaproteobacteria bacterium]
MVRSSQTLFWIIPVVFLTMLGVPSARALTLVELFTSQGCSSCPDADAFLGELARRGDVVPLSFHVGYWDYVGWKDPFALPENLHRQQAYQRVFRESYVYTPEMIIGGAADMSGNSREAALRTIERVEAESQVPVNLQRRNDGALTVTVGEGRASDGDMVWFAAVDRWRETVVRRGENRGRTLVNHNVVRSHRTVGIWQGLPTTVVISPSPMEAVTEGAYVAWVQPATLGPIRGAAVLTMDRPDAVAPAEREPR